MLLLNECIFTCRKSCPLLLNIYQHVKVTSKFVPSRTFFSKKVKNKAENINRSTEDEFMFKSFKGYDDENFTLIAKHILRNPKLLKAAGNNFLQEFSRFYDENAERIRNAGNHRMDDKKDRIDMLFKFETEEDLKKFIVNTDSSYLMGYSSASLTVSEEGTAVFSGHICTDVPKDGNVEVAGCANIITKIMRISFNRTSYFDWSDYTHLVFKIRGDGRSYLINLNLEGEYNETNFAIYSHPLYTRGGPYWQIAKIPFSHFFLMKRGTILDVQRGPAVLNRVHRFGITVVGNDGPFKLEIDYIGLEFDSCFNRTSPYEEYKHNL